MDVIIVGAGISGLAAAYVLAQEGLGVLVLEKGDHPGAKNVTGGRIYLNPIRSLNPGLLNGAPLERPIIRERLTVLGERASATLDLSSDRFREHPWHSCTVLRSVFDRWLSEKVAEKGGFVVPGKRVDGLLIEDGAVVGIRADREDIGARVTILAEGVLAMLAEEAGLKKRTERGCLAAGIKEVIELPPETIEDRFGLGEDEGAAQLFFGTFTEGMTGGGFIYTNRSSLSLGIVLGLQSVIERDDPSELHRLLDTFKSRPEIATLIRGGRLLEYASHMIPEGPVSPPVKPYGSGYLIVGDAAGLALNMGITVRGMDMAFASGVLAARTVVHAKQRDDYSEKSLSEYGRLLDESFVGKDMATFSRARKVLNKSSWYSEYPEALLGALEALFWVGDGPKGRLSATALRTLRDNVSLLGAVRDIFRLSRL